MRRLEQIASEHYIEHTSKDIEVLEAVRRETVTDVLNRVREFNKTLALNIETEFWMENK